MKKDILELELCTTNLKGLKPKIDLFFFLKEHLLLASCPADSNPPNPTLQNFKSSALQELKLFVCF